VGWVPIQPHVVNQYLLNEEYERYFSSQKNKNKGGKTERKEKDKEKEKGK
jgi:hypothetical protein